MYCILILFCLTKRFYGEGGGQTFFWHNRGLGQTIFGGAQGGGQTYFGHFFETPQCVDHIIAARPLIV